MPSQSTEIHELPLLLERDVFMRTLLRELSGTLQDVVGLEASFQQTPQARAAVGREYFQSDL